MIVESLTPVLDVVPGEPVIGRIRVVNDSARDTNYQVRVVGIDLPTEWRPVAGGAVPAGTEVHVDVPIVIPAELGLGRHPVGVEVLSDQASERPGLASMTVSVESVVNVQMRAEPSIVRGSTTGKFRLHLENREPTPVDLELIGGGVDITARFKPQRVMLQPGERAVSKGKLIGKRRWSGDEEQHFVTLTARGRASSRSITTRFVQRSMFPWRLRTLVAALIVIALWLAGAFVYVWYQRGKADDGAQTEQVLDGDQATNGDQAGGGSGEPGTGAGDSGAGGAGGAGGEAPADVAKPPTDTTVGGAVTLADGADPSAVTVSLDELPLGQAAEGASPVGFIGGPAKIWSARYGSRDRSGISTMRQTETIRTVDTTKDGTWKIPNVALRRNYEVVFSRAGYNTQAFVITPPDDGSPVELDVELQPGDGAISGVVRDSTGAIGGVSLVATDGDLVFATTSSTDPGTLGEFSFNGLSTPGVYSVTATRPGLGTEVVQFELGAGQKRAGELISMRAGVGAIIGTVLARQADVGAGTTEQPFGGVTITVTDGDLVRTVTTLTEGAVGTFAVPGLPIPGTYTVTASAPDYSEASLTVTLTGGQSDVQLRLINQFATLRGLVVDDQGRPISGAGVTLTSDDLTFTSNTVSDATGDVPAVFGQFLVSGGTARLREMTSFGSAPGEFQITDLPPGEYRVEVVHYQHKAYSVTVDLAPGDDRFLPITMQTRPPDQGPISSLSAVAKENGGRELEGVSFWLRRPGEPFDPSVAPRVPAAGTKIVSFEDLTIGTYILRAELENYRTNEILVTVGESPAPPFEISLRPFGNVVVRVTDSVSGLEVGGFDLQVVEVRDDNFAPEIINGQIDTGLDGIVWATGIVEELNDGLWKVLISRQPPGYQILDQDLIFDQAIVDPVTTPMQFQVSADSRPTIQIDLIASAYPTVKVRTYRPSTSGVVLLGDVDVSVELDCGGALVFQADPELVGETPTGVYLIPKEGLDIPGVLTADSCQVVASGPGYGDSVAVLDDPLRLANDQRSFDPQVSVVMLPRPITITGRVAWFDGVENVYVPGATIRSTTEVTTAYPPTQTLGLAAPDAPIAVKGVVEAVWDTTGVAAEQTFTLDRQVYDTGVYTVTSPNIAPGSIQLKIPVASGISALSLPNNLTTALASPTSPGTAVYDYDADTNTYAYDITLLQPDPGTLQGCLTVKTVRSAPNFDEVLDLVEVSPASSSSTFGVTPVGTVAGCAADDPDTAEPSQTQGFERRPVAAGVWGIDYLLPDGGWYQFDPLVGPPPTQRIDPAATVNGFDRTVVENATIELSIVPGTASSGPQPVLDTTYTLVPFTGATWDPVGVGADQSVTIRGVPVDAGAPFTLVTDSLLLDIPGYDVAAASVVVGGNPPITGAGTIPVPVQAGDDVGVTVSIDPLGQIRGSIKGYVWRAESDEVPNFSQLTGIKVQARSVSYDDTTKARLAPLDESGWFDLPSSAVTPSPLTPNAGDNSIDFALSSVPPGSYEFRVVPTSNPIQIAYRLAPVLPSGVQPLDVVFPAPAPGDGDILTDGTYVYSMRNRETISMPDVLALELEPSTLDLRVWNSYDSLTQSGIPLAGTQMRVYRVSDDAPIGIDGVPNSANTLWTLTDAETIIRLQPDTYRLEIVHRPSGTDESYPTTFVVTLPSGPTLANRTLQVDAILLPLDFELHVYVKVVNQDWDVGDLITSNNSMNRLPVPDGVVLTRTWDAPNVFVTGETGTSEVSNQAVLGQPEVQKTCAPDDLDPTCSAALPGYERVLVFSTIPSGTHHIQVTAPTGYELVPRLPARVVGDPPNLDYPVTLDIDVTDVVTEFDLVLSVKDVQVDVTITGAPDDDFPGQTASLWYGGQAVVDADISVVRSTANPRLARVTGLPPRRDAYELRLDDELHAPTWDDGITTPPLSPAVTFVAAVDTDDDPDTYQQIDTTVVADVGRLSAKLRLENAPNACVSPFGSPTTNCAALPQSGVFRVDTVDTAQANGDATLDFDRAVSTTHRIEISNGIGYTQFDDPNVVVPLGRISRLDAKVLKLAVINLDVSGAAPADVTITPTIQPGTASWTVVTPTATAPNRWTYYMSPDTTSIGFTVTAPDLFPFVIDPVTTSTGFVRTIPVALVGRTVTVNVTSSDGNPFTPTIDVQVPVTSPTYTESFVATSAATSFSQVFPVTGGPIPNEGLAKATVRANGYRSNSGQTTDPITANQTIAIQLRPLVTVSGSLTVSPTPIPTGSSTVVTASNGTTTHVATVSSNGTYTFADKFDVGTWQVTASVIGWGAGTSSPFTITASSVDTVNVPAITLTPRPIAATLTVQRPNGDPVATGDWSAVSPATNTGDVVALTESGTLTPAFVIRESTSLRTPVNLNLATATVSSGTITVSKTVTMYEAPLIAGLVLKADNNDPDDGTVSLYAGACSGAVPGGSPAQTADRNSGLFTFPITAFDNDLLPFDPGSTNTYCLRASKGNRTGAIGFTLTVVNNAVVVTPGAQSVPSRLDRGYKVEIGTPDLSVVTSSYTLTTDADNSGDISSGDTLTFSVTGRNTGTISQTGLDVRSADISPNRAQCVIKAPNQTCVLTGTYTVSSSDVTAGSITIVGTAKSDQIAEISDSEVTPVPTPTLGVALSAPVFAAGGDVDGSGDFSIGDTLQYTVTVTAPGANLTGVTLTSTGLTLSSGTCPKVTSSTPCTRTGTFTVTAVGSVTKSVTVDSTQTGPQTASNTTVFPTPTLSLTMPTPVVTDVAPTGLGVGDTLTYTLTATNSGTANLTNVTVTATLVNPATGTLTRVNASSTTPCSLRLPGELCILTVTYTLIAADAGTTITVRANATSVQSPAATAVTRNTVVPA